MKLSDVAGLFLLGALWGGSYLFMRVAAPVLGPVWLIELRVLLAGLALLPILLRFSAWHDVRPKLLPLFVVGCFNAALPFLLYAFASTALSAGINSILSGTIPLFGSLFAALWLNEKLTYSRFFGIVLGFVGVVVLVGLQNVEKGSLPPGLASHNFPWHIAAVLLASLIYAGTAPYVKQELSDVSPIVIATMSHLSAALFLLPALPFTLPAALPSTEVVLSVIGLALLSTSLADLLYFRLIHTVGATKALTSAYLIPAFAMLWGAIALQEPITSSMLLGCGLILIGTTFSNDLLQSWLRPQPSHPAPLTLQSKQLVSRIEDLAGCLPGPIQSYFPDSYSPSAIAPLRKR